MRSLWVPCVLFALTAAATATTPQYSSRQDIVTGFKHLSGLAVADFNGDGVADIAVTDNADKQVVIYLGTKTNTFSAPISTLVQTSSGTSTGLLNLVAGDFNEDGKQDLIVGINGSEPLVYLSGNGDGTFTQQSSISGSSFFSNARVVDLNHDSHLDLVVTANPGFVAYLGDGHGNFQRPNVFNSGPPVFSVDIVAADFNGDNAIDVLTAHPNQAASPSGIELNPGNGDGTFKPYIVVGSRANGIASPNYLSVADFNGDGKQDILIGETYGAALYYGNGDGTFDVTHPDSPPPVAPITPNNVAVPLVAAADMDGDGKADAIVADDASQTVDVAINRGSGNFRAQNAPDVTLGIDAGTSHLAIADVNGDGLPDIILANNVTQNVSAFLSTRPKTLPAITVSPSSPLAFVGSTINVTVKIAGSNNIVPTGPVTLMDGSTSLGQQTLDANGQAIFPLSNLAAGYHQFSATYPGDTNYFQQNSILVGQAMMDMQIASTTPSQTVTAGATASYNLTVTPVVLTGTITLTCSQLPALATCDPVTVTSSGQPVSAALTVKTTAPVRSQNSTSHYAFALLPLFAVCCVRRRRILTPLLGVTLICTLGFFAAGCSSSKPSTSIPGTPSGSSTFTITASYNFGGQTLTRTTTATLVVQ